MAKKFKLFLEEKQGDTKLQSLLNAVTEGILGGSCQSGDALPSVNEMSRQTGYSRDTVVKAYNILKQRSLVESTPAKGFFVAGDSQRVFVLLDDFSAFKEQFYRSFRTNLPGNFSVDLLFHHYNPDIFKQLVQSAAGRYSSYVVMNINNTRLHPVLSKVDPSRLLVLDMGDEKEERISFILQNFDQAVVECLEQGIERLMKYKEFVFVYSKQKTPHPPETANALRKFCGKHGLGFHILTEVHHECMIAGQVYFVITENDLVQVLKGCRQNGLSLGSELGIVAFNDTPMKEIAGNGVTVISVDFNEMGRKAAGFVKTRQKVQEVLPAKLIIRNSL